MRSKSEAVEVVETSGYLSQSRDTINHNVPVLSNTTMAMETNPYAGASLLKSGENITSKVLQPIDNSVVSIRPDGIVYCTEIMYRRKLTELFGVGGWALVGVGEHIKQGKDLFRTYRLYISGRFVAEAMGEGEEMIGNKNATLATVTETVKSSALVRCCKDIGFFTELWDQKWIEEWKKNYAVNVFVRHSGTGKISALWRLKSSNPFGYPYKETGFVDEARTEDPPKQSPPKKPPQNPDTEPIRESTEHKETVARPDYTRIIMPAFEALGDCGGLELYELSIGQLRMSISAMQDIITSADSKDKARLSQLRNDIFKTIQFKTKEAHQPHMNPDKYLKSEGYPEPSSLEEEMV